MQLRLARVDGTTITYALALRIARVRIDAFRHDVLQPVYLPLASRLDPGAIPPLVEYEQLREKVTLFERCVNRAARSMYLRLISNPKIVTFVMYDDETDTVLGHAEWWLPDYHQPLPFDMTFGRKFYTFLVDKYFRIMDWLYPTPSLRQRTQEFLWVAAESGLANGKPHTLEMMRNYTEKQLEEITYPRNLCYFLAIIGVRSDRSGLGLGKKLLQQTIAAIEQCAYPPPGVNGPAKLAWQAVPPAKGFYSKLGYQHGLSVVSKKGFNHTVFYKNVDRPLMQLELNGRPIKEVPTGGVSLSMAIRKLKDV